MTARARVRLKSFEAITAALETAGVRYLVAGGLAVAAHGYLRLTKDVDLVVELRPENVERVFAALGTLGYRPAIPITSSQFASKQFRSSWFRDKGMQVLQFWCDEHIETPLDIFVAEPFPFEQEYQDALVKALPGSRAVRFLSLPTLILMKESAGCQKDINDVAELRLKSEDGGPAESVLDVDWSLTTWDGSRREQLRRWAKLPLDRLIMALEEMGDLAEKLARTSSTGR